mmetsp:Transcript_18291/g.27213  ORF Transcript_18291/g.27213 Transcript_18291/m.27213 type:complete len:267 (-) Transcript_18291:1019-1819(-)
MASFICLIFHVRCHPRYPIQTSKTVISIDCFVENLCSHTKLHCALTPFLDSLWLTPMQQNTMKKFSWLPSICSTPPYPHTPRSCSLPLLSRKSISRLMKCAFVNPCIEQVLIYAIWGKCIIICLLFANNPAKPHSLQQILRVQQTHHPFLLMNLVANRVRALLEVELLRAILPHPSQVQMAPLVEVTHQKLMVVRQVVVLSLPLQWISSRGVLIFLMRFHQTINYCLSNVCWSKRARASSKTICLSDCEKRCTNCVYHLKYPTADL